MYELKVKSSQLKVKLSQLKVKVKTQTKQVCNKIFLITNENQLSSTKIYFLSFMIT